MATKHTRTQHFVQWGLFDGLQSFPELENRIAGLAVITRAAPHGEDYPGQAGVANN
jgi:hypothetical protein